MEEYIQVPVYFLKKKNHKVYIDEESMIEEFEHKLKKIVEEANAMNRKK